MKNKRSNLLMWRSVLSTHMIDDVPHVTSKQFWHSFTSIANQRTVTLKALEAKMLWNGHMTLNAAPSPERNHSRFHPRIPRELGIHRKHTALNRRPQMNLKPRIGVLKTMPKWKERMLKQSYTWSSSPDSRKFSARWKFSSQSMSVLSFMKTVATPCASVAWQISIAMSLFKK